MLRNFFVVSFLLLTVLVIPVSVYAALSEAQIQSIVSLVRSFGAESKIVENLEKALRNPATPSVVTSSGLTFVATPASGVAPLTVTFTTRAVGTQGTFTLSFGDSTASEALTFCPSSATGCAGPFLTTHTYNNPGTYVARLSNPAGIVIKNQIIVVSRASAIDDPAEEEHDHSHDPSTIYTEVWSSDPDPSYTPESLVPIENSLLGKTTRPVIASSTNPYVQRFTTTAGPLAIYPIEQATMRLDMNGTQVCVDPGKWGAIGTTCDLILFTHGHKDHFTLEDTRPLVKSDTKIITTQLVYDALSELKSKATVMSTGVTTFRNITVEVLPAYNSTGLIKWHKKGCCNGYILTQGDYRIYIPGDTDTTPELLAVTDIDIMFVPLWPPFTMNTSEAVAAIKKIKPRVVFPFHYGEEEKRIFKGDNPHTFADLVHKTAGNVTEVRDSVDWYWQRR